MALFIEASGNRVLGGVVLTVPEFRGLIERGAEIANQAEAMDDTGAVHEALHRLERERRFKPKASPAHARDVSGAAASDTDDGEA